MCDIISFRKFQEIVLPLYDYNGEFEFDLNIMYQFCAGIHGSMYGSHRGFWIRENFMLNSSNVMDTTSYGLDEFYNFMKDKDLLIPDFELKIEEAILKNV